MSVDLAGIRARAADAHNLAVVATTRPDGSVHASLVSAGVVDDPVTGEPSIGLVVGGSTAKLGHLRRTRRAAVVFQAGYRWASVEGPVRIVGPDDLDDGVVASDVPAVLRSVFVAAGGTHDDWAEYDRVMAAERRAAVFVSERSGSPAPADPHKSDAARLAANLGRWTPPGCETMLVVVDARLETARALGLDRVAADVSSALQGAGVRPLLLKGAALATWMYDDGTLRPYGDVDLLVAPDDFDAAECVLAELGFAPKFPGLSAIEEAAHGRAWSGGGATVDLHRMVWGVGIRPGRAWPILSEGTETLAVGGGRVEVLGPPARALHVALHAAQHGPHHSKPGRDLARLLARLPFGTWQEASALARRLDAEEAMAAGLRRAPGGPELADRLGLPCQAPLGVTLAATSSTRGATVLAGILATPGLRDRVVMTARRLVPTPAQMRLSFPLAKRSPAGMVLAYAWVPLLRMARFPRAAVAVARARQVERRVPMTGPR